MAEITCIEDLRRLARQRVPRMFYDYVDGGSWTEYTYRANEEDFGKIEFRQRVAVDITERSTAGIRSGQDVLKAIALGARGTYIGRAMMYGLGALGEQGVTTALQLIRNELDLFMAFCGRTDIGGVDRGILRLR